MYLCGGQGKRWGEIKSWLGPWPHLVQLMAKVPGTSLYGHPLALGNTQVEGQGRKWFFRLRLKSNFKMSKSALMTNPCNSIVMFSLFFLVSHHQVERNSPQSKFSNLIRDNCQHLHTVWKLSPACYITGTSSNHSNPLVSMVNKTSRTVITYSQPRAVR